MRSVNNILGKQLCYILIISVKIAFIVWLKINDTVILGAFLRLTENKYDRCEDFLLLIKLLHNRVENIIMFVWKKEKKRIEKLLNDDEIKTVSFDIFDTLLVRPAVKPTDIFSLVCKEIEEKYNFNFLEERMQAEKEINNYNITIYDIWKHIGEKFDLSAEKIKFCVDKELEIEEQLLYQRYYGRVIYDMATKKNKRIVAISDMYIPSQILHRILKKKGYTKIEVVYVSCEKKARKDTGELYRIFCREEKIKNSRSILHIGDNKLSDIQNAQKCGLQTYYLPSNIDLFKKTLRRSNIIIFKSIKNNFDSMILGYAINSLFENNLCLKKNERLNLKSFAKLLLFPFLFKVTIYLHNNDEIQKKYNEIFFLSRDGYFPQIAYDLLNKKIYNCKNETVYFYGSRRAFDLLNHKSIQYANCCLKDYIELNCIDTKVKNELMESLSNEQAKLDIIKNKEECDKILEYRNGIFQQEKDHQSLIAKKYYSTIFNSNDTRKLIFDCGYSGSVSSALMEAFPEKNKFDKVYLWETEKNRKLDLANNTKTFIIIGGDKPIWLDVLIEDCFSPVVGSCVGFAESSNKVLPIFESIDFSDQMKNDMFIIQNECKKNIEGVVERFGKYLKHFEYDYETIIVKFFENYFSHKNKNWKIFSNIQFPDTYCQKQTNSLGQIIDELDNTYRKSWLNKKLYKVKKKFRRR